MNPLSIQDLASVYLHPGELSVCKEPTQVITVLGSCVSITMFNPRLQLGAICHGTLPQCRSREGCNTLCIEAFKFMDCAIHYMLKSFRAHGIRNNDIEVKIFGGADTLRSTSSNTIGSQNIKTALDIMSEEELRVIAADVGDSFGRKLVFFSHTGEVFLKRLKNRNGER